MATNENLCAAKRVKNDEFFTRLEDIEFELRNYEDHFKDKVVYLNCDKPSSNFFQYFLNNKKRLSVKKIICTYYDSDNHPFKTVCDETGEIHQELMCGDGDFRSQECINLLKEADIICTNPPFSLLKEFVSLLFLNHKKFVILANKNAITYKEMFPYILSGEVWMGYSSPKKFIKPNGDITNQISGLTRWFTNLEIDKTSKRIVSNYDIDPSSFLPYDNYSAIEVPKVSEIPARYNGVMGVPITFLDHHDPSQYQLIGTSESEGKGYSNGLWHPESKIAQPMVQGKRKYKRLFIKKV